MIACEIADQSAETTNVIEQLVIDAALRVPVGFKKGLFGAGGISCPEPGESELAQK